LKLKTLELGHSRHLSPRPISRRMSRQKGPGTKRKGSPSDVGCHSSYSFGSRVRGGGPRPVERTNAGQTDYKKRRKSRLGAERARGNLIVVAQRTRGTAIRFLERSSKIYPLKLSLFLLSPLLEEDVFPSALSPPALMKIAESRSAEVDAKIREP